MFSISILSSNVKFSKTRISQQRSENGREKWIYRAEKYLLLAFAERLVKDVGVLLHFPDSDHLLRLSGGKALTGTLNTESSLAFSGKLCFSGIKNLKFLLFNSA